MLKGLFRKPIIATEEEIAQAERDLEDLTYTLGVILITLIIWNLTH